jgi:ankyrin repeat protein
MVSAAAYNSLKTVRYLLDRENVDLQIRAKNGFQAIHYAVLNGHVDCVKLILSIVPQLINEQTNSGLSSLALACQSGSLELVSLLQSYNANVNIKDNNGLNCLHIGKLTVTRINELMTNVLACLYGHLHIVQWLVRRSFSTNVQMIYSLIIRLKELIWMSTRSIR